MGVCCHSFVIDAESPMQAIYCPVKPETYHREILQTLRKE